MNILDQRSRDAAIRTIYGEAAGEGADGWRGVASVIKNRVADPRWGDNPYDVAYEPKQFSAHNVGAGGNSLASSLDPNSDRYHQIGQIVDEVWGGNTVDPTGGATHYYSPAGMEALVNEGSQSNTIPKWLEEENQRRGADPTTIGGHIFTGRAEGQDPGLLTPPPQVPSGEEASWLSQVMNPSTATPEFRDKMLAIGQGLLSGDDWSSGAANAAGNLLGLRQQEIAQEGALALQQHGVNNQRRHMGNVEMKDGSIRSDLFTTTDGRILDSQGQDVSTKVSHKINNSDADGSKYKMTPAEAQKRITKLGQGRNQLEAFDRVLTGIEDVSYGTAGFVSDMQSFYNTLLSRNLTPEQIQRAALKGELQGMVGNSKEAVVGGGVMTEQDAARIISFLGGDMSTIMSNPEVIKDRITTARSQQLKLYQEEYKAYESVRSFDGSSPYIQVDPYVDPFAQAQGVLSVGNSDTPITQSTLPPVAGFASDDPAPEGLTPLEWSMMPEEDKALFRAVEEAEEPEESRGSSNPRRRSNATKSSPTPKPKVAKKAAPTGTRRGRNRRRKDK